MNDTYFCYLCAYSGKIIDFRMKKSGGGYSSKRYLCPDCQQILREISLKMNITPFEWGALIYSMIRVFNRRGQEFYYRVSFDKLKKRLFRLGINKEFWNGFYTAKNDWNNKKRGDFIDKVYMPENTQSKLI